MATFELEGPDGQTYEVDAPDQASAVTAFKKMMAGAQQAQYLRSQPIPATFQRPPLIDPNATGGTLRENPSDIGTRAVGALGKYLNWPMMSGADEALAGVYGLGAMVPGGRTPVGAFKQELSRLEQNRRDYEALNTPEGTAATAAGVVLNPLNFVGGQYIAQGLNAGTRAGRAALTGGTIGMTEGLLGTEGGPGERLAGAAFGAGLGAPLGLAAQPAAELIGVGARKGAEGVRGVYDILKNQAAASKDPAGQANKLIAQAFMRDNLLFDLPQRTMVPQQGMVNLGGENVTALARGATVAPGPTRQRAAEFFSEQAIGAPDRAADALSNLSQRGYYGTLGTLDAYRRQIAGPLYAAAYARPAVEVWTPRIAELMDRPSMRAAYQRAATIAAEEGRNPTELGLSFNAAGDPVFLEGARNGQIPSTQTMDYIKRGLDDVMQAQSRDPATGRIIMDEATRAIDNTRREFVAILREQNPEYRAALDAWAGPSHSIEVMKLGRDMFKKSGDPADMIRRFRALPPADAEYARIGFMREAINSVGTVGDSGSVYLKLMGTQNKRALMETMFPDLPSFQRFANQIRAEKAMLATNRAVMGGSPTSRIDADKADAALSGASDVLNWAQAIKTGNPLQILALAIDKSQNLQRGMTEPVATEVGRRIFETNPEMVAQYINSLFARGLPAPARALSTRWLRNTPLVPMLGQGSGMFGAAIATPKQSAAPVPQPNRMPAR